VAPVPLHDIGRILGEVRLVLSGTAVPREAYSSGSARLEAAIHGFDERWRRTVAELAEAADSTAQLVRDAAGTYSGVESRLTSAMSRPR
jgi:hypothetical protein